MAIAQDYAEGLFKQIFISNYLLNGLFPCQSDIIRSLRQGKKEWNFNDKYEYRQLLAHTGTSGHLTSQIIHENLRLKVPREVEIGLFEATYGTMLDGFEVDMTKNLETKNDKASFELHYATLMWSLRQNMADQFKISGINGRFAPLHKIRQEDVAVVNNVPAVGADFKLIVPINVFHSNFKFGRLLIKTTAERVDGPANVNEVYQVMDNQPGELTLRAIVGSTPTTWIAGQFLEVFGNREYYGAEIEISLDANKIAFISNPGAIAGLRYTDFTDYVGGDGPVTGAMEGIQDLLPWHFDPATGNRLGMDHPFRGQPNRLRYSTELAGQFYLRKPGERIMTSMINALMRSSATVNPNDLAIFINPVTLQAIGEQEAEAINRVSVNMMAMSQPLIFTRGISAAEYRIGNNTIKNVIEDFNLPTDVILVGPKNEFQYNCWDNSVAKIDDYIKELYSGADENKKIEDIDLPSSFTTSLDLSRRLVYGSPYAVDGRLKNGFRHPGVRMPLTLYEMGSIFTEKALSYTVINLRHQIVNPTDATEWAD
jgi:hypothetical protein